MIAKEDLGNPGSHPFGTPNQTASDSGSEKRKMLGEISYTLSRDPLSVQFLWSWFWSLLPGHSPLHDQLPWMNFRLIRWLDAYLRPDMTVFEYGPGGSTIFMARRVRRVVSIEHDPLWFDRVQHFLADERITNCDVRLVLAKKQPSVAAIPYGPSSYTSQTPHARGLNFEAYVRSIDEHPDHSFDLVIVDGYARFSCVAHAVRKVRPGGYLLFDDSDWKKYREAVAYLDGHPRTDFVGVTPFQLNLRQTTIWRL